MNNTIKKIIKGTLAIFMIKLVIFGGFFIIQSCQNENINGEFNNDVAKNIFLKSISISKDNLNNINAKITNSKNINMTRALDSEQETAVICLIDPPRNEELIGFGHIIQTAIDWDLVITEVDNGDPSIDCYEVLIQDAQEALNPSISAARQFLLSRELTNVDIDEILDGANESALIPLVQGVLVAEYEELGIALNNNDYKFPLEFFGIQSASAQNSQVDWTTIRDCALIALGLDSLAELKNAVAGKKLKAKVLKKAAKKVVKKFVIGLTGWGTVILVAQFTICVGFAAL